MKRSVSTRARPEERLETWCEAKTEACTGRAEHRHHLQGRVGEGVDEREATLDVCAACHRWIHDHPKISYERGWLLRRVR